jgi:hypothetical protein
MQQWYYLQGGHQLGPVSLEALRQLAASGDLLPTDLVWTAGAACWTAAESVAVLFPGATRVRVPGLSGRAVAAVDGRRGGSKGFVPVEREVPGRMIVCERKPFLHVLLSPWGLFNLLMALLTFGFTLLLLAGTHFLAMPRRVWLQGGRLGSDQSLPGAGVALSDIRLEVGHQTLGGVTANRYLRLYYRDERGKERFLNLNQVYFGRAAIDRVIATVSSHGACGDGRHCH